MDEESKVEFIFRKKDLDFIEIDMEIDLRIRIKNDRTKKDDLSIKQNLNI